MVGSYQTITYNRYAVQSATKFKAKIVDIPFCDPESGFAILIASRIEDGKSIVLKGIIPNPVENAYITYQGHWEQDARRGTQYVKVESSEIDYEAGGTDSIYELLTSGYVPGVGPVTAKKIIKAFGADSLKIIEKSPEKLTELAGIKEKAAKKIHDAYIHIAKDQELISFLLPFISMQKINAVLKEYGDSKQALAAIKENPYCLYQDVSGIGFAASDRIALVGLGMDRKDQRRVEAIVLHSLEVQAQMEGHSFVWLNQLMACVATTVEKELHESRIPEQSIRDAVNGARRKGLLVAEKSSGNASGKPLFCVYLRRYWALECDITFLCHTLHHCMNAACGIVSKADVDRAIQNVQMKDGFLLDDTQKQAAYTVYGSDSQNVTVITGGPGSGKTTIIKTIIEAFMVAKGSYYKEEDILLCAPTGRASARMREATGHAASTIQSAYFGCFDNEASVIVVDEFDFNGMKGSLLTMSMFVVLDFVWTKIKEDRTQRKAVFIDECWKLIGTDSNEQAAEDVVEIFRTIRAYGGSAFAMTQDISQFYEYKGGKYGKAIIGNADTKIIMHLIPSEAKALQEAIQLTSVEMEAVSSLPRGQGLVCSASAKLFVDFVADDYEAKEITTDAKSFYERRKALEKKKREEEEKAAENTVIDVEM